MSVQPPGSGVERGAAARLMIAEDARWAADVALSAQRFPSISGYIPLIIGQHLARIAFEGSDALRSADSNVGIPQLAALLKERFSSITARARHAAKLLDDSSTDYQNTIANLELSLQAHRARFTGNTCKWLQWLESDFGLYKDKRCTFGSTIATANRLSLNIVDGKISGESVRDVSEEWGAISAVLGVAALDASDFSASIDFGAVKVKCVDRLAGRYFGDRFDPSFPIGLKILLQMIEGDLNSALHVIPHTADGHAMATFRAQTVTAYHSLSSLRKVCNQFPNVSTEGILRLRAVLDGEPAQRLVSQAGTKVRDRCVHYPIKNPTFTPDFSLPMYGLIESLAKGTSWSSYHADVISVSEQVADALASW